MNINTAIAKARKLLAKKGNAIKNPAKIIILKDGEKPPENTKGVIIIKVLLDANVSRSL